ncbi:MAG TPA: hypothetical protein VLA00_16450 [Xanthobacteraceae bacterium]|nr:hypothetical protein [Xanthobacteraceae bacterium]
MGADFWPYGFETNRHVLNYFTRAHHRQGLSARPVEAAELFHASTLERYVI